MGFRRLGIGALGASPGLFFVHEIERRAGGARFTPHRSIQAVSSPVALLEFLLAATRAWVVAADVLQGVANRLLVAVVAMRAVHMAVVVIVVMIVTVVAVRAMNVGLLGHCRVTPV